MIYVIVLDYGKQEQDIHLSTCFLSKELAYKHKESLEDKFANGDKGYRHVTISVVELVIQDNPSYLEMRGE